MIDLDMRENLELMGEPSTRRRIAADRDADGYGGADQPVDTPIRKLVWEPYRSNTRQREEGQSTEEWRTVFVGYGDPDQPALRRASVTMRCKADQVLIDGAWWEVKELDDYKAGSYYEARCVRVGQG